MVVWSEPSQYSVFMKALDSIWDIPTNNVLRKRIGGAVMPFADTNGVRIHYQVEGAGPPLLLHHGLTGSLEDWREFGYVDSLKSDYQLILMDARGHGASDKPHNPEVYTMEQRVSDVTAVLDDLSISSAHFFGYSYGGRAGLEFAKLAPGRVRSLIVGGSNAGGRNPGDPNPVLQLLEAGPETLVATFEQSGPMSPGWRARLLANDMEALIAISKSPRLSLEEDLPGMTMPFLVYAGESDDLVSHTEVNEYAKRLPNATFFSLPGLDHLQGFTQRDVVLPHVEKFLTEAGHA